MSLSRIKKRIVECLTRDVRRSAEEAVAQEFAACVELDRAVAMEKVAEVQAKELQAMDRRNHYTESLIESYRPKGRTA